MRRPRLRIQHLLRIPVVSSDQEDISRFLARFVHGADCQVRLGNRFYCSVEYPRMANLISYKGNWKGRHMNANKGGWGVPHHVRRREITHDKLMFAFL